MITRSIIELPHGVTCIDIGLFRPRAVCCYLVESGGHAAVIESGTTNSVPTVMNVLKYKGIPPENVAYVIPTHVHLDHAGGAGALLERLPAAKLVIHPRGARHMIDPERLWQGAAQVYGEEKLERLYGRPVPVAEDRIIIAGDGHALDMHGRRLEFIDTPGHARHHFSVWDEQSRGFFTGDTFGFSYREFDSGKGAITIPTTTPVQFDPDAWRDSLQRYLAKDPQRMYLTHFSMVEDIPRLAAELQASLDDYVDIAGRLKAADDRPRRLKAALTEQAIGKLREHGCPLPEPTCRGLLNMDMDLNTQGLEVWLDAAAA